MDYYFSYDLTFSSIQYINIYTYQHDYLYIYKYDILIEIYKYINFFFFDYNVLDYIFSDIYLNYFLYNNLTLTKFCGFKLNLNLVMLINPIYLLFVDTIILWWDFDKIVEEINRNLYIYFMLPYNKYTIVPLLAYYDITYLSLFELFSNSKNYLFFNYFVNWLYYFVLDLNYNVNIIFLFYILFIYLFVYLFIYLYVCILQYYLYTYIIKYKQINYLFINIFYLDKELKTLLFFYGIFYNPIFLYRKKKEKESNEFWADVRTKTQISMLKNEDVDISYIYIYDMIKHSYKKYILLLQFSLFIRYIFFIFYFILYIFCFIIKYIYYLIIKYISSVNYLNILILIIYSWFISILNYNLIKKFFTMYVYLYLEFFLFIHQQTIPLNYYFFSFLNFLKPQSSNLYNNNLIDKSNIFYLLNTNINISINKILIFFQFNYIDYNYKYKKFIILLEMIKNIISYYFFKFYYYTYINYLFIIIINSCILFFMFKLNNNNFYFVFLFIFFLFFMFILNKINFFLDFFYYSIGLILFFIFNSLCKIYLYIYKIFMYIFIKLKFMFIIFLYLFIYILQVDIFTIFDQFLNYIIPIISLKYSLYFNSIFLEYELFIKILAYPMTLQDHLINNLNNLNYLLDEKTELTYIINELFWNWKFSEFNFEFFNLSYDQYFKLLNIDILWNFLIYDLNIKSWFSINIDWSIYFKYCKIYIFLLLSPYLGWWKMENVWFCFFWYIIKVSYLYIIYFYFFLQYIYLYILPKNIYAYISLYYGYIYPIIFYIKYNLFYLDVNLILNIFFLFFFKLFKDYIQKIFFLLHNFLDILWFFFFLLKLFFFELIKNIYFLLNIQIIDNIGYYWYYFYINIFSEFQSDLDSICSYYRINRFKLYKWTKRSNNYGYKWNVVPIRLYNIETIILHKPVKMKNPTRSSSILSFDSCNYFNNVNMFINYLKYNNNNTFNQSIYDDYIKLCVLYYKTDEIQRMADKNFTMSEFLLLYKLYFKYEEYLKNYRYNFLLSRPTVYYFVFFYIFIYWVFRYWYNSSKLNQYNYNSQYIWTLFRKDKDEIHNFELNYLKELNNYIKTFKLGKNEKINKGFSLLTKKTIKSYNKFFIVFQELIKKNYNISDFSFFLNDNRKKKMFINYWNFFNFSKKNLPKFIDQNIIYNFIFSYKDWCYYNILNEYSNYLNFFIAYMYKKSKYIRYICKHELFVEEEPIKENIEFLTTKLKNKQTEIMWKIIYYFSYIDDLFFNKNSPNWFLHKNQFTIFINNKKLTEKNTMFIYYSIPYEIEFFFFFILFYIFFFMYLFLGLHHVSLKLQRIHELYLLFNLWLNNKYMIWEWYSHCLNILNNLKSFKWNLNGIEGAKYNIVFIYMWSYKYNILDLCLNLKYSEYLIYKITLKDIILIDYICDIKKSYIVLLYIYIIYFFIKHLIILHFNYIYNLFKNVILLYIYNILNNEIKILYKKNNILNNIFKHIKIKYYLWNNYFKK